jgi:hypothetical protein
MKLLGVVSLGDVLADWGIHEAEGRFTEDGTVARGFLDQFTGSERRLQAIGVILQKRLPVVAAILAARPKEYVRIEVTREDVPSIFVMGQKALTDFSRDKLAEDSRSADWVRSVASGTDNITGPVVAVARRPDGPITLFDGMHRMAAWVAHLSAGRDYPVVVSVVVTTEVAPRWELPG